MHLQFTLFKIHDSAPNVWVPKVELEEGGKRLAKISCLGIGYEMIDLIEYMTGLRYHIEGLPALEKDCSSCNKIGSLQIIDL